MSQATMNRNEAAVAAMTGMLNKQVANCTVMFMKLHHFHWYVKGDGFYTLHEKFEQLYDEMNENLDALAERLLTIGGQPVSTLHACLQQASIREADGGENAGAMVQCVIDDFRTIIAELARGMEIAQEHGDESTFDMLLGMCSSMEKHIWMLTAYLGE